MNNNLSNYDFFFFYNFSLLCLKGWAVIYIYLGLCKAFDQDVSRNLSATCKYSFSKHNSANRIIFCPLYHMVSHVTTLSVILLFHYSTCCCSLLHVKADVCSEKSRSSKVAAKEQKQIEIRGERTEWLEVLLTWTARWELSEKGQSLYEDQKYNFSFPVLASEVGKQWIV